MAGFVPSVRYLGAVQDLAAAIEAVDLPAQVLDFRPPAEDPQEGLGRGLQRRRRRLAMVYR